MITVLIPVSLYHSCHTLLVIQSHSFWPHCAIPVIPIWQCHHVSPCYTFFTTPSLSHPSQHATYVSLSHPSLIMPSLSHFSIPVRLYRNCYTCLRPWHPCHIIPFLTHHAITIIAASACHAYYTCLTSLSSIIPVFLCHPQHTCLKYLTPPFILVQVNHTSVGEINYEIEIIYDILRMMWECIKRNPSVTDTQHFNNKW